MLSTMTSVIAVAKTRMMIRLLILATKVLLTMMMAIDNYVSGSILQSVHSETVSRRSCWSYKNEAHNSRQQNSS